MNNYRNTHHQTHGTANRQRTSTSVQRSATRPQAAPRARTGSANSSTHQATSRAHSSASKRTNRQNTHTPQPKRPLPRAPFVIAVLAALAVIAGAATTAFLNQPATSSESASSSSRAAYVSPYDFTGLDSQGDRMTYSENGVQKSQVGIDVSELQGSVNWQAVKNDGISFAFLRAGYRGTTEGGLFTDSMFEENFSEATAAGLQVGAYFYSQATSVEEAQQEAELVLSLLGGRNLDLPIVFDHEQDTTTNARGNSIDRDTLTAAAKAFCERIEAAGYASMIYGNKVDIARLNLNELDGRLVWFAEYNAAQPSGQFDFALWQYTNNGTVSGISTPVDLNLRFTDAL